MRTALVLALLTAAPSQIQLERQQIRPTRVMRVLRAGERGGVGAPFFRAFNGSSIETPVAESLCDALALSDRVGQWYCLQGDGGTVAGSQIALSPSGSPSISSAVICPSGGGCEARSSLYSTATTQGWAESAAVDRSASVTSGGYTMCWEGQVAWPGAEREVVALSTSGLSVWQSMLYATSTWNAYISTAACSSGITTLISASAPVSGGHQFVCLTWAASDGKYRLYVDGVSAAVSAGTYTTICGGGATSRHAVSGYWNTSAISSAATGHTLGAFYTAVQLDAGTLGDMAARVLASNPLGAKGEALTFARASTRSCLSDSNIGSMLPAGRPCVAHGGKVSGEGPATNLIQRSEELDNVAWADVATGAAAPTLNSANASTVGVLNLPSAEDYTFAATTAGQRSGRAIPALAGCSGVQCAASIFVYGVGASGTLDVCNYGTGTSCAACSVTNGAWGRCAVVATVTSPQLFIGNNTADNGGTARSSLRVLVMGGQMEVGNHATSYIPTTSTSASRVADSYSHTLASIVDDTGSAAFTYEPAHTGSAGSCGSLCGPWFGGGDTNSRPLYTSSGTLMTVYDGTNTANTGAGFVAGTPKRYCSRWSAGGGWVLKNLTDGTSSSAAFSGTLFGGSSSLTWLTSAGASSSGWWSSLCFSRTGECCP